MQAVPKIKIPIPDFQSCKVKISLCFRKTKRPKGINKKKPVIKPGLYCFFKMAIKVCSNPFVMVINNKAIASHGYLMLFIAENK